MIGNRYKVHKVNVIDLFNRYKERRGHLNDGINIDFWEGRIESIKNGKYILAVAGEVKAGKSTFINALLGTELLPTGILQSTNAIVEIFKSENQFLKVKYADGKEEEIYDDLSTQDIDEPREKLKNICRIHDRYRNIPTNHINKCIIDNNETIKVTNKLIRRWESELGLKLFDKKELIIQYIKKHTKENIPVEISFGYPLKWNFDELRIVDSPGVNALGDVENISFKFFEKANAILFVHPVKPVESLSFRKFVNSVITNRSKETLFLVLTHTSLYPDSDIETLHSQAVCLYKDLIPEERIIVVDSLLKLIHNDIEGGKTLKQIEESSEQKSHILPGFKNKAKKENTRLEDILLKYSHFEKMYEVIDRFSMQAPNLQLQEILESIKKGYEYQEKQYGEKIERLEKKKRNPQEFEAEIDRINKALDKYKSLKNNTIEELEQNYTGRRAVWVKKTKEVKEKYSELSERKRELNDVRKEFKDDLNEIENIINDSLKSLTETLSERLKETGKKFQKKYNITPPVVDLESIEEKSKKEVNRKIANTKNIFWKLFNILLFGIMKKEEEQKCISKNIYEKISGCILEIQSESGAICKNYLKYFTKEMNIAIEYRKRALQEEKDKKQTNNDIIAEIEALKVKKNEIQPELKTAEEIVEDLK